MVTPICNLHLYTRRLMQEKCQCIPGKPELQNEILSERIKFYKAEDSNQIPSIYVVVHNYHRAPNVF